MKITLNRQLLLENITRTRQCVDKDIGSIAAYSCFLFSFPEREENMSMHIRAASTARDITTRMPFEFTDKKKDSGLSSFLVPADGMANIIASLPQSRETLTFERDDSIPNARLTLRCGSSSFRFPTLPASEWGVKEPDITDDDFSVFVPAHRLVDGLFSVANAIQLNTKTNNGKVVVGPMTGVFLCGRMNSKEVEYATADGSSLAYCHHGIKDELTDRENTRDNYECDIYSELEGVLPRTSLPALKAALAGCEQDEDMCGRVGIFKDPAGGGIGFMTENMCIRVKTIDGRFPNFKPLIKLTPEYSISIDRKEFVDVIQRLSLFTIDGNVTIKLNTTDNTTLRLSVEESSKGGGEESIIFGVVKSSDSYNGLPEDGVRFDGVRLIRALKGIESESVVFNFQDEPNSSPMFISNDKGFMFVVMPLKPPAAPSTDDADNEKKEDVAKAKAKAK